MTSRWLLLAHAYYVWSTSIDTFVSYAAHRQNQTQSHSMTEWQMELTNDKITERNNHTTLTSHISLGGVKIVKNAINSEFF